MHFYQRVCLAVARHGISGLPRRVARKWMDTERLAELEKRKEIHAAQATYKRIVEEFESRIKALDLEHLRNYYWYHTIDLGNGVVTPGDYDYRDILSVY